MPALPSADLRDAHAGTVQFLHCHRNYRNYDWAQVDATTEAEIERQAAFDDAEAFRHRPKLRPPVEKVFDTLSNEGQTMMAMMLDLETI